MASLSSRADSLRQDILSMVYTAQSGHIGGPFSIIDFLTALFFDTRSDQSHYFSWTDNAENPSNDIVLLSKAHCSPAFYALIAELGWIEKSELATFRLLESRLQGHVTNKVPGGIISGGSLGQGLSAANGIGLAYKLDGKQNRVWTILGDGELQEGQIWEAAMTSAHFHLNNNRLIVDHNKIQIDGRVEDVMNIGNPAEKFRSFGWEVCEVMDGHDFDEIHKALEFSADYIGGKPLVIILHTIKGKGVSFMENTHDWHGKAPNDEEYDRASKELSKKT